MSQPVAYTTAQVAEMLDCSTDTVVAMCKNGQLRHLRLRREFRITEDPIEALSVRAHDAERDVVRRWLEEAKAEGSLPAEPAPETLALIARILRQHYAEQADRAAG
jgi:excisionase family DNA binding protein